MAQRVTPAEALLDAIEALGSQVATAKLLGVTQGAVSKWCAKGQPIPAEHVLKVEEATGISRHELRPDLYPREPLPPPRPASLGDMDPVR